MFTLRKYKRNNASGQISIPIISLLILTSMLPASLAVDFMHINTIKGELQNATDAGALSGAQDLWTKPKSAEADALTMTAANMADGRSVAPNSGITVNVVVTNPSIITPGQVKVTATMKVRNLHACLFNRLGETITTTSIAGTSGTLLKLNGNQAFPLAVSIDAVPQGGRALSTYKIGESISFNINAQKFKNAGWTSFTNKSANANYIDSAINQAIGLEPVIPGFIPAISIGDQLNLNNGVIGQKKLGQDPQLTALKSKVLVLPVISGDPALNQTRALVGFIGFKVTTVDTNGKGGVVESLTGVLESPQVLGVSGSTGGANSQLGPVQLIK